MNMTAYMKDYLKDPGHRSKHNKHQREYNKRPENSIRITARKKRILQQRRWNKMLTFDGIVKIDMKKKLISRKCKVCGHVYITDGKKSKPKRSNYCSFGCLMYDSRDRSGYPLHYVLKWNGKETVSVNRCAECHRVKTFARSKHQRVTKYCSKKCARKAYLRHQDRGKLIHPKIPILCKECGRTFTWRKTTGVLPVTCSKKCKKGRHFRLRVKRNKRNRHAK